MCPGRWYYYIKRLLLLVPLLLIITLLVHYDFQSRPLVTIERQSSRLPVSRVEHYNPKHQEKIKSFKKTVWEPHTERDSYFDISRSSYDFHSIQGHQRDHLLNKQSETIRVSNKNLYNSMIYRSKSAYFAGDSEIPHGFMTNESKPNHFVTNPKTLDAFIANKGRPDNFSTNRTIPCNNFVDLHQPGVYTFHNICIIDAPEGTEIEVQHGKRFWLSRIRPKQLVVYNSKENLPPQRIHVNISWQDTEVQTWDIAFSKDSIPVRFTYITNHAAYFVITSCDNNLYHFWEDHARDLHTALNLTGMLGATRQQLYYKEPLRDILPIRNMRECTNPDKFEPLLLALPLLQWHDTYHKAEHGTCYQNAVFGAPQNGAVTGIAEEYVIRQLQHDHKLGECSKPLGIVLIQRLATRQILNLDEIYTAIMEAGYINVNIYSFERMSVLEQLRIVHCSAVLIGVHGQALEWHVFMNKNTALIEIAWPQLHWPFFYTPRAETYGKVTAGVEAKVTELDWDAWTHWFFDMYGYVPSEDDIQGALNGNNTYGDWGTVWRFANVKVSPELFNKHFQEVVSRIGLQPDLAKDDIFQ